MKPIDGLAYRIDAAYRWHDLVTSEAVRAQLRQVVVEARRQKHSVTALFAGPAGTGKTIAASILAADLGRDLYRIDVAAVVSKYIGETEKNLARIFDAAEKSDTVLFFDEADALFGKRTDVHDSHDRYANIEIGYLLQRMEAHAGLTILATNNRANIDSTIMRRLRYVIDFTK